MLKILSVCSLLAEKVHLHWVAHYRRVTGKPPSSGHSFTVFDSICQVPDDVWDASNAGNDIFLSSGYLAALEQAPPDNMSFRYAIISKENVPVGIAYFQIVALNYRLHQSPVRLLTVNKKTGLQGIHDKIVDTATLRILICGNAMISGEHGFSIPAIPKDSALHVIAEIAHILRKSSNPRITVTLIKDFYKQRSLPTNILSRFGYYSFDAGPNMVIPVRRNWTTFDNYLNDMKSKYRKRTASAIRKGSAVCRQSLGIDDLIRYRDELFALYCRVVDKARFRIFSISPDYFIALKKQLGDKFICDGYFSKSTMVGFTTRIFNGDTLEGYAHGLQYERNKELELYQNFLLDDVRAAIDAQSLHVNTGRTSVAMKSSVGAVPRDMVCYMRFSGGHSNQLIKPLFFFIKPSNEYCRNPFEEH